MIIGNRLPEKLRIEGGSRLTFHVLIAGISSGKVEYELRKFVDRIARTLKISLAELFKGV